MGAASDLAGGPGQGGDWERLHVVGRALQVELEAADQDSWGGSGARALEAAGRSGAGQYRPRMSVRLAS